MMLDGGAIVRAARTFAAAAHVSLALALAACGRPDAPPAAGAPDASDSPARAGSDGAGSAVAGAPVPAPAVVSPVAGAPAAAPVSPAADGFTPFEGTWLGTASGPRPIDVIVVVERKDGAVNVIAALPSFGSLGDGIPDAAVRDGRLTGTLPAVIGQMRMDVAASGDVLEGTIAATPPGAVDPTSMPLRLERSLDVRASKDAKAWAGQLDVGAQQLMVGLSIAPGPGERWSGTVDFPAQGVQALPVFLQRTDDGRITARIPVPGDATLRLEPDGDGLRGTFSQGNFQTGIAFRPHAVGAPLPAPQRKARPQDPKPPFPYENRTVRITVPEGHTLEGTYSVPAGASAANPVPGVVLVTGSGPQDRDESIMGHRPFEVLADALARKGIAVLRCDDRGFGASTGDFASATIDGFASDAAFAFLTLASKPEVDPARVAILGHSEGASAAALATGIVDADPQAVARVASLVLLAGPGVDGDRVLREQNARLMLAAGKTEAEIAAARAAHAALLDAVKQGADDVVVRARARETLLEQLKLGGNDVAALPASVIDPKVDATVQQLRSPWMRRFLEFDPASALRKVSCPVLVLNGTLDTQVDPAQNVAPIEAAVKEAGQPVTAKVLPGLNHLFQPAKTGEPAEYATIDVTMDPAVLALVADWLRAQPRRQPPPPPPSAAPAAPVPVAPVPIGPIPLPPPSR